jgi:hypothetical protein
LPGRKRGKEMCARQRKVVKVPEWLRWFLFLVVILWGTNSAQAQTIGKTVDKNNYKEYETLLIPAMLRAVERGDFILPTGNLEAPYKHWNQFLTAGEKNAGKFDVNEMGDLIDKGTGKIPKYNIYGYPFPKIDPKDPRIADKIIWNFNFQRYRIMGTRQGSRVLLIRGEIGEEKYIGGDEALLYYQGRSPGHEMENPQNFLINKLQRTLEPMSAKGTNTLTWDYFDEREISQFAYVAARRRVRQMSGAGVSRSDRQQGGEGWPDLNYMWEGKNRSMTWKLAGERTILAPFTKITKDVLEEAPDGMITRKNPFMEWGFRVKDWKGAPWAPTTVIFVPRPVWVVEQMPLDPNYNWGLHINYVDKETSVIWYKEINDKSGQFRSWRLFMVHYSEAPSGNNDVGEYDAMLHIDEKIRHATIFQRQPHPEYSHVFLPASRLRPDFFTLSNFLELSK